MAQHLWYVFHTVGQLTSEERNVVLYGGRLSKEGGRKKTHYLGSDCDRPADE